MYQRRTPRDTNRYRRERSAYLRSHPLCAECARQGRTVAATELDHITPYRKRPELFWDKSNWQGLCRACHERKTAAEHTRRMGAGLDGWPVPVV